MIDIIRYLEDHDINISYEGEKNVSKGWIGIQCIFPDCFDNSNHLGICLYEQFFSCYICGEKGNLIKLIQQIDNCTWEEALKISRKYEDEYVDYNYLKKEYENFNFDKIENMKMPSNFISLKKINSNDIKFKSVLKYIKGRGFDEFSIINKYNLFYSGHIGKDAFRLIIPIYYDNKLVSYVGRDISGLSDKKYKNASNEESTIPTGQCIYEIDKIKKGDKIIIVEGPIDQWKLGDGSVALLGYNYTSEQIRMLRLKDPSEIIILFDNEYKAQIRAKELANDIWFCNVKIRKLTNVKDPGSLTTEEGNRLKIKLLGNIL